MSTRIYPNLVQGRDLTLLLGLLQKGLVLGNSLLVLLNKSGIGNTQGLLSSGRPTECSDGGIVDVRQAPAERSGAGNVALVVQAKRVLALAFLEQ